MKQISDEGRPAVGVGIFTGSPVVVQMIGHPGFDFVFIDMEHTPATIDKELQVSIIVANKSGTRTCVRVKYNDETLTRITAEFGADAVVVPHCRAAEDARKIVQAVRFPLYDVRGPATDCRNASYGCYPDFNFGEYVEKCNREILIIPLAEDPESFDNMDEILDVEGLGGVQLGPPDLALGLGIKETYNFDSLQVKNRFKCLFKKAKEKGIPLMGPIAPPDLKRAIEMVEGGVRVMTLRDDVTSFKTLLAGPRRDVYIPLKKHPETV